MEMDEFVRIFDDIQKPDETPEECLAVKIEEVTRELVRVFKGDVWFHEDIIYSEYDVINWLKKNRPEFYKRALEQPETVEGNDNLVDALKALGLWKEWIDVDEDELRTPEDRNRWKGEQKRL